MIKIGICGFGVMGKNHLRNYKKIRGVSVDAIYDPISNRTCTQQEFLEMCKSLDGVSVCCPTSFHVEMVHMLLGTNPNLKLLVEKPISHTYDSALALLKYEDSILVGHVERHNPVVSMLKSHYTSGVVGEIFTIYAQRSGLFPARTECNNVAVDLLVHDIDIVNYLLGSNPSYVKGSYLSSSVCEVIDYANLFAQYGKANCYFDANWLTPHKVRKLTILSSEGLFVLDYINQTLDCSHISGQSIGFAPERKEPLWEELNHFVDFIKGKCKPLCTVYDGTQCLRVLEGIV